MFVELPEQLGRLNSIAELVGAELYPSSSDPILTGFSADSRSAKPGSLFVALRGASVDGHRYIRRAQEGGSVAALVETLQPDTKIPLLRVDDTHAALSRLSAAAAGFPARSLKSIGITGTNGKTTSAWLLAELLNRHGLPTLSLGTLGARLPGEFTEVGALTTPAPEYLHQLLAKAVKAGAQALVMEASSHALDQRRVDDVEYDLGIFTNLTRDHLDYHGDEESYFEAKRYLFELLAKRPSGAAVVNLDDPFGVRLIGFVEKLGLALWTFGFSEQADVSITGHDQSVAGSVIGLRVRGQELKVRTPMIGRFNALNIAGVLAAAAALEFPVKEMAGAFTEIALVPGRLEPVGSSEIGVYVDYSHTPDSLSNALQTLRPLVTNKLWVVFGCGGDRDRGKRPEMGAIASDLADRVVVTSDNPRTEQPDSIIQDILAGVPEVYLVEPDRHKAIRSVILEAESGDVVLIAGKGHEDYQIIGETKRFFSDSAEARSALSERVGG